MAGIFPTAQQMRQYGAKNARPILAEIRHLEVAILDAADAGKYTVLIDDSPFGLACGSGIDTFLLWKVSQEKAEDSVSQYYLDSVRAYFTNLGYAITAKTNTTTNRSIRWEIQW